MRFKIALLMCVVLLFGGQAIAISDNYDALLQNKVSILVDGAELSTYDDVQKIDLPAFLYNNRTLLPLRKTFSVFNVEPKWNPEDRSIEAEYNGNTIWLQVDNPVIKINNKEETIDVPAKIFENRAYVPIRKIFEALGMEVDWDNHNRRVEINTNNGLVIEDLNISFDYNSSLDLGEEEKINETTYEIRSSSNSEIRILISKFDGNIDQALVAIKENLPFDEFQQVSFNKGQRVYYSAIIEEVSSDTQHIFLTEKNNITYLWYFNNLDYETCLKIIKSII